MDTEAAKSGKQYRLGVGIAGWRDGTRRGCRRHSGLGPFSFERRLRLGAFRNCARASRMKSASRGRMQRARNRAGNGLQAMVPSAVEAGNRFEQPVRVRIQRISKQLGGRRLLHHPSRVQNRHIVGILATMPRSCVTRITARPSRTCNSRMRSRICAWIVTFSAVVGSSAISSAGHTTAPSRSSPADACRPRADADSRRSDARDRQSRPCAAPRSCDRGSRREVR